ncbi:hypothetical protein Goarm_013128 [Gossypium armourianum]|uniref:Uncharacterized protein n=1 Tax=Gossypium armourianum TaxID=34283 RepID=A0A7J9J252_9ROSI|nr:hypothetical protein [Gossypium armourianum]
MSGIIMGISQISISLIL